MKPNNGAGSGGLSEWVRWVEKTGGDDPRKQLISCSAWRVMRPQYLWQFLDRVGCNRRCELGRGRDLSVAAVTSQTLNQRCQVAQRCLATLRDRQDRCHRCAAQRAPPWLYCRRQFVQPANLAGCPQASIRHHGPSAWCCFVDGRIDLSVGAILTLVNIVGLACAKDADAARHCRGLATGARAAGQRPAKDAAADTHDHRYAGHDERLPPAWRSCCQGHTVNSFSKDACCSIWATATCSACPRVCVMLSVGLVRRAAEQNAFGLAGAEPSAATHKRRGLSSFRANIIGSRP